MKNYISNEEIEEIEKQLSIPKLMCIKCGNKDIQKLLTKPTLCLYNFFCKCGINNKIQYAEQYIIWGDMSCAYKSKSNTTEYCLGRKGFVFNTGKINGYICWNKIVKLQKFK